MTAAVPLEFETPEPEEMNGEAPLSDRPPQYRIWKPVDIWAPIDPPIYAIGTLTQGDIAMMCAHGSSLKSWAGINAVLAKAHGGKWVERFDCEAAPARYLDNEMGSDECRRRMQRNALAEGLEGPVPGVSLVSMPGFYLSTAEGIAEVRKLAEGQALMVIDSLPAFCPDVDENDARFADPLKRMKDIGESTKCAFLVLHHSRKSKGDDEDQRERPRGTSALYAACDVVFQLSRYQGGFLVQQTKARKGKAADSFVLRVADVGGAEATRVYACDLESVAQEAAEAGGTFEKAKAAILLCLGRDHDVRSGNELVRRLKGIRRGAVLDALKELRERGTVAEHDGRLRLASEVKP